MRHKYFQDGFSLLELSISIIVIGIILSIVTSSMYILRQSELKQLIIEAKRHLDEVHGFQNKFQALPGDFLHATDFFAATANGDGNEKIIGDSGGPDANEGFRAWQHLELSGMVNRHYTGIGGGGADEATINVNVPESIRKGGGYAINYNATLLKNGLLFGNPVSGALTTGPLLTPTEAEYIDRKLDDDLPNSGTIRSLGDTTCFDDVNNIFATTDSDAYTCALFIFL